MPISLADIQAARQRIKDVIYHTPCPHSFQLTRLCGIDIYCKLDHLQITGSFKERGARNKLLRMPEESRRKGVVAVSAGNHAQALAYHGKQLGIAVTVCMPKFAPLVKVKNCREFGAEVIQEGETFEEARQVAAALSAKTGKVIVPGFDDPDIIAGAGTVGLELLEDVPDLGAVIVPVGGGGLLAGISLVMKTMAPHVRVIGVEAVNAPTLRAALDAGKPVTIEAKPTLADGLAVGRVGDLCFDIIKDRLDELVLVDESQIGQSVLRLMELEKIVVEGAGAVPLAVAMKAKQHGLEGKKTVLVLCGGNIDVTAISRVIDRGLAADGRLCRIHCYISDRPGGLASFCTIIAAEGASIREVFHDRSFAPADVAKVAVSCVMETRDFSHIKHVMQALLAKGVEVAEEGR